MDKIKNLAKMITTYSIEVKENENVLINSSSTKTSLLIKELIKAIYEKKANVTVRFSNDLINAEILKGTSDKKISLLDEQAKFDNEHFDSFISIYYNENDYQTKDVPSKIKQEIGKRLEKNRDILINEKKWVLLQYPSSLDAFKAKMNSDVFYNYAFDVMTYDYKQMAKDVLPLKKIMEKTDKVRLTGINTDLTFSIKGMNIIPCTGEKNIPDGEIYCGPIKDSVNGYITYNTPSPYQGHVYNNVKLTLKNGKIINATCNEEKDIEKLNEIFDTDEGSRFIGEFAIGLNPLVKQPMGDTLYDEKIIGSIHFTPGCCYDDSNNGNKSAIHWDMVLIQREDYGGGNIYFDDILIRENGLFIHPNLLHLNYNNKN